MYRLSRALIAAAAVAGAVVLAGCGGGSANKAGAKVAQKVTALALANVASGPDASLQLFADAVARRSKGKLRIDIRSSYRQGDANADRDTIRDVQRGRVQLSADGARGWDAVGVKGFRALIAPFLIDSYPLEQKVLASPIAHEMLASVKRFGFVGIAVLPGPLNRVSGRRPLLRPADFHGITFATSATPVAEDSLRTLGARPMKLIGNAGLPRALGGVESFFASNFGNAFYKQEPYLMTNLVLWPRALVVVANRKAFDSLSSEQQQVLRQAAVDATGTSSMAAEKAADNGAGGARALCKVRPLGLRFVKASPADLAALFRAERPEYAALVKDPQTRSFISRIEALKRQLGVPADAGPGCPKALDPSSWPRTPTVLDGVYRLYVSLAHAAAGDHVSPSKEDPANWGEMVMVLDRGRYATTQQSTGACTWGYGRYRVYGDKWETITTDAGGVGGLSRGHPGEQQLWLWSFYRGTLTLRADTRDLPGMYPFPPFTWTPVTKIPSAKYLSARCAPPSKWLH